MTRSAARLLRTLAMPAAAVTLASAALAQGQLIDLSTWQPIQYEFFSQADASWDLQPGNTSVIQSVNADASIFLSDFDAVGQTIQGTWRVETGADDDFMGFVFGYQGRGQYYLLDWKGASQNTADVGMSLKIVQMPVGMDPTSGDLWPTAGSANVTVPLHNTVPWVAFVDYEFELTMVPGNIEITVREGTTVLEHWVLADSTYTSGQFGFYNYSQGPILYQGFTQESVATIYCDAKVNSQGCLPILATMGDASFSDTTPFEITATMLINNRNGMLFYGLAGRAAVPFGGGTLCVAGPLLRAPIQRTGGNAAGLDCSGSLSIDINALLQGGGAATIMAGDQVNAQFFYRDPQHADGTGYGLTEGVEFVVLP
ncbi:MAG: hypothetical protein ACI8Y8_002657 [Planctomycetota bacterium]|jgi:hypothetical protein